MAKSTERKCSRAHPRCSTKVSCVAQVKTRIEMRCESGDPKNIFYVFSGGQQPKATSQGWGRRRRRRSSRRRVGREWIRIWENVREKCLHIWSVSAVMQQQERWKFLCDLAPFVLRMLRCNGWSLLLLLLGFLVPSPGSSNLCLRRSLFLLSRVRVCVCALVGCDGQSSCCQTSEMRSCDFSVTVNGSWLGSMNF